MSAEVSKQQTGLTSSIKNAMPMVAITSACSAGSAIKTYGIKGVGASFNKEKFNAMDDALKAQGHDVFTRSTTLAKEYDNYRAAAKAQKKAQKKVDKLASKKQTERIAKKSTKASKALKEANEGFEKAAKAVNNFNPKAIQKTSALKSLGNNFKSNFKNELGFKSGWFNYLMTAIQFVPNVINEVIPAFKEEGFVAGIKETGKTLARAAADLVGFAAGGSIGRIIGSTVGMLIPFIPKGVGARIGGNIGDIVGSMIVGCFVTDKVDKLVGANQDEANDVAQNSPNEIAQNNPNIEINTQNKNHLNQYM